jgi:transmembrane sensor
MPNNIRPSRDDLRAAAQWDARLRECPAGDPEWANWQCWHDAAPAHQAAWAALQALQIDLAQARDHRQIASSSLQMASQNPERRRALRAIALGIAGGAIIYPAYQWMPWQVYASDYRTASGESQHFKLADGSEIWLAADSALDVDFTAERRNLRLVRGQMVIETGADPRPMQLHSAHATITPLGTRFAMSHRKDTLTVAVFDQQVRVAHHSGAQQTLAAGQALHISPQGLSPMMASQESEFAAWRDGLLVLQQTPLAEVIAQLAPWRSGLLQCDASVAALPVSGVLSLRDTDAALAQLARSLPIRVSYRSRWWVRIDAI